MPVRVRRMAMLSHRSAEQARGGLEPEAVFVLATAILLDEGTPYADLSVEQIARKAGRSRSTFYVYFRDKRELLLHATQEIGERLYAVAADWLTEPGRGADVRDALAGILSIYQEHPGLLAAVVEASGYDERVREHWRELMGGFVEATERRLAGEELLTNGERTASVHAQAFALVWMTERACYQQVTGGGVGDDEALVDALAEIWGRTASWTGAASPVPPEPPLPDPGVRSAGRREPADWGAPPRSSAAMNAAAARRARRQPAPPSERTSYRWLNRT
jgi:TetR/AcrR family transcriptional regulator, ethionamide resistance regulator